MLCLALAAISIFMLLHAHLIRGSLATRVRNRTAGLAVVHE